MAVTNEFDKYVIKICGGNAGGVGQMVCYKSGTHVGTINFYPVGTTFEKDYLYHPSDTVKRVILSMPMDRFEAVMSTVRNEKPVYLFINVNVGSGNRTLGPGYITTNREPVGDNDWTRS